MSLQVPLDDVSSETFLETLENSCEVFLECLPADHKILGLYSNFSSAEAPDIKLNSLLAQLKETYIFEEIAATSEIGFNVLISTETENSKFLVNGFSEVDVKTLHWDLSDKSRLKPQPVPLMVAYKGMLGVPKDKDDWEESLEKYLGLVLEDGARDAWLSVEDVLWRIGDDVKVADVIRGKDVMQGRLDFDFDACVSSHKEVYFMNLDIILNINLTPGKSCVRLTI
jgi:hypothetical protein